jgi:hypothetical protein
MSNFHFDLYHWNFPKGRCMTFQGRCKNSREVQNDLRGGAPPHINPAMHYIIIQLTPHWGFSVTDYIKHYAYLSYLLFIFTTIVILLSKLCFPSSPTLSTFPAIGNRSARRKPMTFGRALTKCVFTWVRSENRTQDLRGERRLLWRLCHCIYIMI